MRAICSTILKVSTVLVLLSIGSSACWVSGGVDARRGGYPEHHEHHEERR